MHTLTPHRSPSIRHLSRLLSSVAHAPANAPRLSNSDKALASAETVTTEISNILSSCASDHYIIVKQSGVSATDYKSLKRASALRDEIKSTAFVRDVIGTVDTRQWRQLLHDQCGAEVLHIDTPMEAIQAYQGMPKVIDITFPAPSPRWTREDLQHNDAILATLMESLRKTNYTVLWTTTPPVDSTGEPATEYDMEDGTQELLHTGLRRDLASGLQRRETNVTLVDGPLFHRYQFFTPGRSETDPTHSLLTTK